MPTPPDLATLRQREDARVLTLLDLHRRTLEAKGLCEADDPLLRSAEAALARGRTELAELRQAIRAHETAPPTTDQGDPSDG
ncbi:MAG: hypothetical protein OXC11_10820 [Rhodospirillales bacterium]|nr:hypothetical protein [Rhodospirillales bacterium]